MFGKSGLAANAAAAFAYTPMDDRPFFDLGMLSSMVMQLKHVILKFVFGQACFHDTE